MSAILDEESSKFDQSLTNQDIANAIWILADAIKDLDYLKSHTHRSKTVDVIESAK